MKNNGTKMNGGGEDCHYFSQLAVCTTIAEFKESLSSIVRRLGFTDFSFTVLDAPPAKNLSSLPESVRDFDLRNDFVHYDFILEHAAGSNAPMFLSALEPYIVNTPFASERIQRNAQYHQLLASLGYHDGYSLPHSFGRDSRKAVFSFFAKDATRDEFRLQVEQCQPLLPMIVGAAVYFGFTHFPEYLLDARFAGQPTITPKPLEMLEAVAKDGLLLKEAARKLNINLDTANKHIAAVKHALGATTLAHAVYLAMAHGLLRGENGSEKNG